MTEEQRSPGASDIRKKLGSNRAITLETDHASASPKSTPYTASTPLPSSVAVPHSKRQHASSDASAALRNRGSLCFGGLLHAARPGVTQQQRRRRTRGRPTLVIKATPRSITGILPLGLLGRLKRVIELVQPAAVGRYAATRSATADVTTYPALHTCGRRTARQIRQSNGPCS